MKATRLCVSMQEGERGGGSQEEEEEVVSGYQPAVYYSSDRVQKWRGDIITMSMSGR